MTSLFDLPFEEEEEDPKPGPPADLTRSAPRSNPDSHTPSPEPRAPSPESRAPAPAAAPEPRTLTVSQLTARIRTLLEEQFFEVWVEGELSNCRVWGATGHMYFTLKDRHAQIKGVMFRLAVQRLKFKPQDGIRVVARGKVSIYDRNGEYQIICEHLEPEGIGARQLALEQMKQRLQAEGLFDPARKRPLPALPRRIGIVTSLEGAAIHDIVKVFRRRYPTAHLIIRPTRVQGDGAAMDIMRALRQVARVTDLDVIIVGRGGGSIEDLWAFNEEVVARAIAGSPVPTISAVGHESDVTIADLVADMRASTPSVAAEMVVSRKDDFCGRIDRLSGRVQTAMRGRLHRVESRLRVLEARPGYAGTPARISMRGRAVADLERELRSALGRQLARQQRTFQLLRRTLDARDPRRVLGTTRTRLVSVDARLAAATRQRITSGTSRFSSAAARLQSLSPLGVLARGYAVAWNEDRTRVIRDADTVAPGDRIHVRVEHGELDCDVVGRKTAGPAEQDRPTT